MLLVLTWAIPLVAGLAVRKWWVLVLPVIFHPLYGIGLNEGWWGCCGTGDSWQYATALATLLGLLATGGAILIGRAVFGAREQ